MFIDSKGIPLKIGDKVSIILYEKLVTGYIKFLDPKVLGIFVPEKPKEIIIKHYDEVTKV